MQIFININSQLKHLQLYNNVKIIIKRNKTARISFLSPPEKCFNPSFLINIYINPTGRFINCSH